MDKDPIRPAPEGGSLDRYRILRPLGAGGMGEVFLAQDTVVGRKVALKRLPRAYSDDPELRRRLLKEARRAARVEDPRLASLYDVIERDDEILLVMEYVEGRTLREIMNEPVALIHFWDLAVETAKAVEVVHRNGMVHRDLKPDNLIINDQGQVKILDFGIAQRLVVGSETESLSTETFQPGRISGTPAYMSPEAHLGEAVGPPADVFSLGVMFHEMLAAERPFAGGTYTQMVDRILHERPARLAESRGDVPEALSRVVLKMLSKRPEHRYADAAEVTEALVAARHGEAPAVVETEPITRPVRPMSRRLRLGLVAGAVGVVVLLAVALGVQAQGGMQASLHRLGLLGLPEVRFVAVLPPDVAEKDDEQTAYEAGVTMALTHALNGLSDDYPLQVSVPRDLRDEEVKDLQDARTNLGVNLAFSLDFRQRGGIRVNLLDATNGKLWSRRDVEVGEGAFSEEDALLGAMIDLLGFPVDPAERHALIDMGTQRSGTLSFLFQGHGYLQDLDTEANVRRALSEFERAATSDPQLAAATAGAAKASLRLFRLTGNESWRDTALVLAKKAVDQDPDRAECREVLGQALAASGDREAAYLEFARGAELDPTNEECLYRQARYHGRSGDWNKEQEFFRAAIRARPHCWRAYWWLGVSCYRSGDVACAREAFAGMARNAPDYYEAHGQLGGLLLMEGDNEASAEVLSRAIDLKPTGTALSNLGTAYFNLREFDRAIDAYDGAIETGYADYLLWLNLGDAYWWSPNRRNSARAPYREALQLGRDHWNDAPYDMLAPAVLAPVWARIGEPDSARAWIGAALADDPDNPMVTHYAALTAWELGERDTAMDLLDQAVGQGYPINFIQDSPMFDEWMEFPQYQEFLAAHTEDES